MKIIESLDKEFFEKKVYSSNDYLPNFNYDEEILNLILSIKSNGNVLDLGCGDAGLSLKLAELGFDVTCVDISKTICKLLLKESNLRNIKLDIVCSDISKYNLVKNYDVVLGLGIFHFFDEDFVFNLIDQIQSKTNKYGLNIYDVFLKPASISDSIHRYNFYFEFGDLEKVYSTWKIINYDKYSYFEKELKLNQELLFAVFQKNNLYI